MLQGNTTALLAKSRPEFETKIETNLKLYSSISVEFFVITGSVRLVL